MKNILYISLVIVAALLVGCKDFNELAPTTEPTLEVVEILDNGEMLVSGKLSENEMCEVSVSSRAASSENNILTGWCIIFGESPAEQKVDGGKYTPESPMLLRKELTINANGTFFVTLPCYAEISFLRVVINLTPRETASIQAAKAWGDSEANYENKGDERWLKSLTSSDDMKGLTTFGDYIYQSVGLDGIYNIPNYSTKVDEKSYTEDKNGMKSFTYSDLNTVKPNPTDISTSFPMASIGFIMENGITAESLKDMFGKTIYMVRVCSKVDVTVKDDNFKIKEIYMINCAQESRLRSTVLSESADIGSSITDGSFKIPVDLGGTIDYEPLKEVVTKGGTTSPIYFYPNSGGNYSSNNGVVNQEINPQYIIIKGRAGGYDTDGYYKVALKAQYPLEYEYDNNGAPIKVKKWSKLTYDILRNTHFTVSIDMVKDPGYKTLDDAKNNNNPASNISYSIITSSEDSRNEILVSNGSYFVELHTNRVYMKGYDPTVGNSGKISFNITPSKTGNYTPEIYVMGDYGVQIDSVTKDGNQCDKIDNDTTGGDFEDEDDTIDHIHDYWFNVPSAGSKSYITVKFTATYAGRIRIRIGDMMKFIPVYFEKDPFAGEALDKVSFYSDDSDFSYDEISYLDGSISKDNRWFTADGKLTESTTDNDREMRAKIYPVAADGVTKLYFKQAKIAETFNPDDKDYGDENVLDDGNVIHLDGITVSTPDGSIEYHYKSDYLAAEAMKSMLKKYDTIYIEGKGNYNIISILYMVQNIGKTYALNLLDYKGNDFEGDFNGGIFNDNTSLSSITIPATGCTKIDINSFVGCSNLRTIIIGEPNAPATNLYEATNYALQRCTSLETVLVYTINDNFTIQKQASTPYFSTSDIICNSEDAVDYNAVLKNSTPGTCACYEISGGSGYLHIFYGKVDDFVDENGCLLSKYYTATK